MELFDGGAGLFDGGAGLLNGGAPRSTEIVTRQHRPRGAVDGKCPPATAGRCFVKQKRFLFDRERFLFDRERFLFDRKRFLFDGELRTVEVELRTVEVKPGAGAAEQAPVEQIAFPVTGERDLLNRERDRSTGEPDC